MSDVSKPAIRNGKARRSHLKVDQCQKVFGQLVRGLSELGLYEKHIVALNRIAKDIETYGK